MAAPSSWAAPSATPNHAASYSEVVPTLDAAAIGRYGPSPVTRYDLMAGRVDPRLFPADDWRRCVLHALRARADTVGSYGDPVGSPALRRAVTHWIAQTRGHRDHARPGRERRRSCCVRLKTFGSFAVDDIDAATSFYRDTLGLKVSTEAQDGPQSAARQRRPRHTRVPPSPTMCRRPSPCSTCSLMTLTRPSTS